MRPVLMVNKRVRVYATLMGVVAESNGTVESVRKDGMYRVLLDKRGNVAPRRIIAHPKQCRLLKKKLPKEKFMLAGIASEDIKAGQAVEWDMMSGELRRVR